MKNCALLGRMRVGKTTLACEISRIYGHRVMSIADPLKQVARCCGWNGQKDKAGRMALQLVGDILRADLGHLCLLESLFFRGAAQRYRRGKDAFQWNTRAAQETANHLAEMLVPILGADVVRRPAPGDIIDALVDVSAEPSLTVVDDVRLKIEADRLRAENYTIIRVHRPEVTDASASTHKTEREVDYVPADVEIWNSGTIGNFEREAMLLESYIPREPETTSQSGRPAAEEPATQRSSARH